MIDVKSIGLKLMDAVLRNDDVNWICCEIVNSWVIINFVFLQIRHSLYPLFFNLCFSSSFSYFYRIFSFC